MEIMTQHIVWAVDGLKVLLVADEFVSSDNTYE